MFKTLIFKVFRFDYFASIVFLYKKKMDENSIFFQKFFIYYIYINTYKYIYIHIYIIILKLCEDPNKK